MLAEFANGILDDEALPGDGRALRRGRSPPSSVPAAPGLLPASMCGTEAVVTGPDGSRLASRDSFFHMRTVRSSFAAEPARANASNSASRSGVATRVSARTLV